MKIILILLLLIIISILEDISKSLNHKCEVHSVSRTQLLDDNVRVVGSIYYNSEGKRCEVFASEIGENHSLCGDRKFENLH